MAKKPATHTSYDLFSFGHISLDIIKTPDEQHEALGGAILHAAWVSHQLGFHAGILTKTSKKDKKWLKDLPTPAKDLFWVQSKATTSILNDYKDSSMERRDTFSQGQADPYKKEDFPPFEAKLVQYSALMQGEVDLPLLQWLAGKGQLVIDAGMVRKVLPDKTMDSREIPWLKDLFPYISYFKCDAAEASFLTGTDTDEHDGRVEAANTFLDWGAKEVLESHNQELMAVTKDGLWSAPFKNRNLSGRTGRGDTAITSYILFRLSMSPEDAVRYAAALTSLKMETPGPFKGTRDDVEQYIAEYY
jgi:sugar/nucleoside kinase (ribokinase family)